MIKMAYQLIRTTPEGVEKPSSFHHAKKRHAVIQAAQSLRDNIGVSKPEATRLAEALDKTPVGQTVLHERSGYRFRIEEI